jgi:methyl-accepting chemotaxis protein
LVDYDLKEIKGKHHRIFVDPEEAKTPEYESFWNKLREGKSLSRTFKRFGKNNNPLWIEATYNPILNIFGFPYKVIKLATNITEKSNLAVDQAGQIEAIHKSQAIISFGLDGTILDANQIF